MQDIEEEMRDVVFDYQNSQALVAMANNFLTDDYPKSSGAQSEAGDNQSSFSKQSSMTSKIRQNIDNVGAYDPTRIKLLQDRLGDREKARLNEMLSEIDENLEDLMREKEDYHRQALKFKGDFKSQMSRVSKVSSNNAFLYSEQDQ